MKRLLSCRGVSVIALLVFTSMSGQAEVFFGNLHSHTAISDGSSNPRTAYRHARDTAGLDVLAITEHNHAAAPSRLQAEPELYNGSQSSSLISQARRFTRDNRFVALYGQEFSSIGSGNHANVLDVDDVIETTHVPNGRWDRLLNEWLAVRRDSQGQPPIVLLNHPAQSSSPNDREYGIDDFPDSESWRTALDKHAQLINIINGPSHGGSSPGRPSESEFLRYLNLGLHVGPTADQDNHRRDWGSAAETRTGIIAESLTKPAIMDALRNRRVYATQDRNLRLVATINDAQIGTIFTGADVPVQGTELDIAVEISDDDEPNATYVIDVFSDVIGGPQRADIIAQFTELDSGEEIGNGSHELPGITYEGGRQYLFLRVTQSDPDRSHFDRAWLAPVWFEPNTLVPSPAGPVLTLEVNLETERARITNTGSDAVDLEGWELVSTRGDQRFVFNDPLQLAPGRSVTVVSGPNASDDPPNIVFWTESFIWRNAGDPGELRNPDGVLIAQTE